MVNYKHLYDYKWRSYSKKFLRDNPLCVDHLSRRLYARAEVVDHIKPHRGNEELFWDKGNHQGLCKQCHDSRKQRYEKSGTIAGANENGVPLDPNHHWNKQ